MYVGTAKRIGGMGMRELLERLKRIRGIWLMGVSLLIGILLLVLPYSTDTYPDNKKISEQKSYENTAEHKITQMINALSGVEDAVVLVTSEKQTTAADTSGTVRLSGNDSDSHYRISGIAVICRGGDRPDIRLSIIQMLTAAFDLSSSRVYVGAK